MIGELISGRYEIEELVGHVPYEKVWGLLVDENLEPGMPDPEPYEPKSLSGNAPAASGVSRPCMRMAPSPAMT